MEDYYIASVLYWKVSDLQANDELDLPELTSIQFGGDSMFSGDSLDESSEFTMRSTPLRMVVSGRFATTEIISHFN